MAADPEADAKKILEENSTNLAKLVKSSFDTSIDVKVEAPKIHALFVAAHGKSGKTLSKWMDSDAYGEKYKEILVAYVSAKSLRRSGLLGKKK